MEHPEDKPICEYCGSETFIKQTMWDNVYHCAVCFHIGIFRKVPESLVMFEELYGEAETEILGETQ